MMRRGNHDYDFMSRSILMGRGEEKRPLGDGGPSGNYEEELDEGEVGC